MPLLASDYVFEWIVYGLSKWAFLEALEYIGSLSILIAVIFYFAESGQRLKQKHYQAWQVINTAQGKGGSGGRIEALQELDADKVPLIGVDVAGAFLQGVQLPNAKLLRSDFHGADVRNSNFQNSDLMNANLAGANFRGANFRNAYLQSAVLTDVDLNGADLGDADLTAVDLSNADLRFADLRGVKWKNMQGVQFANLYGVKNAPPDFLDWAMKNGAVLIETDAQWDAASRQHPR